MKTPSCFLLFLLVFPALGCSDGGGATEGALLLTVYSPPGINTSCCGPFVASVQYELTCERESGPEVKTGALQAVDESESFISWESVVDGISPGECILNLVARDPSDEIYCTTSERVAVVAGDVQEPQLVLICTLSFRPRSDLTEEERRACIEANSPCFSDGDDSF